MKRAIPFLSALLIAAVAGAVETKEEPGWGRFFETRKLEGTMVVLDEAKGLTQVWNVKRAETRFAPASTFKIPNALIGLDAKSVKDLDEVIPYGGGKAYLKEWEQDMNLRDAMKVSNVPVFHQLARRTGLKVMREKVRAFDYGNADVGNDIGHRFWLREPLAISAMEQVRFLAKLAKGKLPVSAEALGQVKSILRYGEKDGAVIYAKTGWVGPEDPQTGWWVGWVEKGDKVFPFAMNIEVRQNDDAKQRIPITLECLGSMGVY